MIGSQFQLENSREKLRQLEELYEQSRLRETSYARDVSLRSLRRRISKFKEEIAVYTAHQPSVSQLVQKYVRQTAWQHNTIPDFDENGYLPAGVHQATLDEVEQRFGREPELRRIQFESIRWMVKLALQAGVLRIIINGSYVTDCYEPNDVDCVLLIDESYPLDRDAVEELEGAIPFVSVQTVSLQVLNEYVADIFATDRCAIPNGMVEVIP